MERNVKLDNLKAFLIFTVVLGHSFEFLCVTEGVYSTLRAVIYSFHMPTFVFISGYLSKHSRKPLSHITVMYLSTYVFINTVYGLTPWRATSPFNLLFPQFVYWYLLSLWFWRVLTPAISKVKFIIPASILLTLYIGFFTDADRFMGLSKTICFFPFFLAGYSFSMSYVARMNKRILWIALGVCFTLTIYANIRSIIPVKMYDFIQSYSLTNVGNLDGVVMRLFMMTISFIMIVCLLGIIPNNRLKITMLGQNSLIIYLFHLFIIRIVSAFLPVPLEQNCLNIGVCIGLSVIICLVLGVKSITRIYNKAISKLIEILVRE